MVVEKRHKIQYQIQGGEEAHKSQSRGQEGEAKRTVFLEFDP